MSCLCFQNAVVVVDMVETVGIAEAIEAAEEVAFEVEIVVVVDTKWAEGRHLLCHFQIGHFKKNPVLNLCCLGFQGRSQRRKTRPSLLKTLCGCHSSPLLIVGGRDRV